MKRSSLSIFFLAVGTAFSSASAAEEEQRACQVSLKVLESRMAWRPGQGPLGSAGKDLYFEVQAVESQSIPLCELLQNEGLVQAAGLEDRLASSVRPGDRVKATIMYRVERPGDVRPMPPGLFMVVGGGKGLPPIVSDIHVVSP